MTPETLLTCLRGSVQGRRVQGSGAKFIMRNCTNQMKGSHAGFPRTHCCRHDMTDFKLCSNISWRHATQCNKVKGKMDVSCSEAISRESCGMSYSHYIVIKCCWWKSPCCFYWSGWRMLLKCNMTGAVITSVIYASSPLNIFDDADKWFQCFFSCCIDCWLEYKCAICFLAYHWHPRLFEAGNQPAQTNTLDLTAGTYNQTN